MNGTMFVMAVGCPTTMAARISARSPEPEVSPSFLKYGSFTLIKTRNALLRLHYAMETVHFREINRRIKDEKQAPGGKSILLRMIRLGLLCARWRVHLHMDCERVSCAPAIWARRAVWRPR